MSIRGVPFRHSVRVVGSEIDANFDTIDLLVPFINAKEFGAKGDGITDDGTAVQAALDATNAEGGGTVYFSPGTYLIGKKLTVYTNTTLRGSSYGSVTLKAKASLNDRLIVNSARDTGSGYDSNVILCNLIFDLNGSNQSASTVPTFSRTIGHQVISCKFMNSYDSCYLLTGSPDVTINTDAYYEDVFFDGSGQVNGADVVDIGSGTNIRMHHCKAVDAKSGTGQTMLSIAIINGFSITDSWIDGNGNGGGMAIYGVRGGKVDGCEIFDSLEAGIRLQNWAEIAPIKDFEDFEICNCNIHDNGFDGIWINHAGTEDRIPKNIKISNCDIWNNAKSAVRCLIVHGLKIISCDIYNNSTTGVGSYPVFDFNGAFGTPVHVTNVMVAKNHIYDTNGTPKQTVLYIIDWGDTIVSCDNFISQITTITTTTNSTNIYLMGRRVQEVMSLTFNYTNNLTNKFIGIYDSGGYSRTNDFFVERVSLRVETAPGVGQSVTLNVTNGSSTMSAAVTGTNVAATTTTNAFLWDSSANDLTIRYTSSAGALAGPTPALVTITGFEYETN